MSRSNAEHRNAFVAVEDQFVRNGVGIFLSPDERTILKVTTERVERGEHPAGEPFVEPLSLDNDLARALYEALADHFGHSGHDTRALRRDYEAERARVDKMIDHLLRPS